MINTQKSVISWTCDQEVSVFDRSLASVCSLWSYPVRVVLQPANKTATSALSILISLRGPRQKNEIGRGVSEQGSLRNRRKFSWTCEQEAPILERTLTCVLCLEFSGLYCPSSSKARREIPFSSKKTKSNPSFLVVASENKTSGYIVDEQLVKPMNMEYLVEN